MYIHELPHPHVVIHYHPTREQFTLDDVRFALGQQIHALELDLHFRQMDGQVVCNHDGPTRSSPSLEAVIELILEIKGKSPSVYDDGCQFFLVLEPKTDSFLFFERILGVLSQYTSHLSTAVQEQGLPRGITVVITGAHRHGFYSRFAPDQIDHLCVVEDRSYSGRIVNLATPPMPFQWVALESGSERGRVNNLHAGTDSEFEGRFNVRVWDCSAAELSRCLASGVDQINCNREQVTVFKQIIQEQSPLGRHPALHIRGTEALLTWRGRSSSDLYVALGRINASGLRFARQVALTHLLADECLALSPTGALSADGRLLISYEGVSDSMGLARWWHLMTLYLPRALRRRLRRPQALRYVSGRFSSLERFVTFDGQERRLSDPSGAHVRGRDPAVALGPGEWVLIVYESLAAHEIRYFSARLSQDGVLVGRDYSLIEGEVCLGHRPTIAVDQKGQVVVVYESPRDQGLMYVSGFVDPSGRIVGRRFSLAQGGVRGGFAPSVALDGAGQVIVAYRGANRGRIWYISGIVQDSGRINGLARPLTSAHGKRGNDPSVAFDQDGNGIILYVGPDEQKLWYVHGALQAGRLLGKERLVRASLELC